MNRDEVLGRASELINGDRQRDYGDASRMFDSIARAWSGYLRTNLTPVDVANMMVLLKVMRAAESPDKADNYVDMAGYAALAGELSDA